MVPELRIGILLKARTFLSVASGREGFPADAVLYRRHHRDGKAIPCIPGSTVKGVLRKSAAKVAHLLGLTSCRSVRPEREFTCMGAQSREGREGGPCDVHRVFGAPGHPSRSRSCVEVTHFLPVAGPEEGRRWFESGSLWRSPVRPSAEPVPLGITRVSIYDRASVASPGLLYTYEQLPIGTTFYGEVAIRTRDAELREKALKLVLAALANLRLDRLGRAGIVDVAILEASEGLRSLAEGDPVCRLLLRGLEEWWWS